MTKLLETISSVIDIIWSLFKTTITATIVFFESILEVVNFALGNRPEILFPAFVLPAFILLVVFSVVMIIINRK